MGREISSIEVVRERMVDRVLVVLSIVMVPGVLLSWSRALLIGVKPVMFFHAAVAVILCVCALLRAHISFGVKITLLVVTFFVLGTVGLITFGLVGLGGHLLIILIVMTTAFLGKRQGWLALGISGCAATGVAVCVSTGVVQFDFDILAYSLSPVTWAVSVIGIIIFSAVTVTVLASIHDALLDAVVSLRKQAVELAAARDQAESANRAKSTFIGRMSHELRTPLNAILGFTQIMTGDRTFSSKHKGNLEVINNSGENLLRLINDVLEMSRIEAGQARLNPVGFNLHRLLDGLEGMFRLRAEEKDLQLVHHKDPSLPQQVRTDEAKLLKVLINLLDNAIKFTEKGGVTLRGAYRAESHRLFFEVEDTGPGISPEDMESLFEAFVQPDVGNLAQEGLGLGLPISQQYVRLMDGEITVSGKEGQGSIFKFDVQIELAKHMGTGVKQEELDRIAALAPTEDALTPAAEANWEEIELPSDLYSSLVSAVEAHNITNLRDVLDRLRDEAPDLAEHLSKLARQFDMDGIKAVLEEINQMASRDSESTSREILTPETLSVLPKDWRSGLVDAASRADAEDVLNYVQQIDKEHADIVRELTNLVHNFRFDRIVELAQVREDPS